MSSSRPRSLKLSSSNVSMYLEPYVGGKLYGSKEERQKKPTHLRSKTVLRFLERVKKCK